VSSDTKTTVGEYLTKMGVNTTYDDKLHQFRSSMKLKNAKTGQELDYPIAITILPEWVVIEAAVIDLQGAPREISLEKVYDGMLRANFIFPEVNYAIYKSFVVSIAWSRIPALSLENFMTEFGGVMSGVEKFYHVVSYAQAFSAPPPKEFSPIYQ